MDMTKDEIFEKLKEIIIETYILTEKEAELVNKNAELIKDIGCDEFDLVELVINIEEDFDIVIPDEEAVKIATVYDLIRSIEKELDKKRRIKHA